MSHRNQGHNATYSVNDGVDLTESSVKGNERKQFKQLLLQNAILFLMENKNWSDMKNWPSLNNP